MAPRNRTCWTRGTSARCRCAETQLTHLCAQILAVCDGRVSALPDLGEDTWASTRSTTRTRPTVPAVSGDDGGHLRHRVANHSGHDQ